MAAVYFPTEPESGVDYKLSGDELLDLVKRAAKDYEWHVKVHGRASITLYRTPIEIRRDAGEPLGALV